MKKTIYTVIAFLHLICLSLFAQDNLISIGMGDLAGQLHWNNTIQPPSSDIEGSPYLNKEFEVGEVFYSKKFKITQIPLRYNLYNDDMEYKVDNSIMAIANPHQIDTVFLGKEVFIYLKNRPLAVEEVGGFVRIWNSQYPAIITKMKVEYLEKEAQKALVDPRPARFERKDNKHFLMNSHQDIVKIKSVKKLIQFLGNHKDELTKFAKKEKVSSKNPEELAKLIDYYQGLIE